MDLDLHSLSIDERDAVDLAKPDVEALIDMVPVVDTEPADVPEIGSEITR